MSQREHSTRSGWITGPADFYCSRYLLYFILFFRRKKSHLMSCVNFPLERERSASSYSPSSQSEDGVWTAIWASLSVTLYKDHSHNFFPSPSILFKWQPTVLSLLPMLKRKISVRLFEEALESPSVSFCCNMLFAICVVVCFFCLLSHLLFAFGPPHLYSPTTTDTHTEHLYTLFLLFAQSSFLPVFTFCLNILLFVRQWIQITLLLLV